MVRFDQAAPVAQDEVRSLVQSEDEPVQTTEVEVSELIQTVEVLLDLDGEQQDAVGSYWKSMRQSRKRREPIVESDSEEDQSQGKRRVYG